MAKQRKSPEKQAISRNPDGTFPKGVSGNPEGKTAGTLDFKTQWFNFIEKVAKQNNLLPEDIDNEIFAMVLKEMRKGNFQFYKDTKDRLHGKAAQPFEGGDSSKPIIIKVAEEIAKRDGIQTDESTG